MSLFDYNHANAIKIPQPSLLSKASLWPSRILYNRGSSSSWSTKDQLNMLRLVVWWCLGLGPLSLAWLRWLRCGWKLGTKRRDFRMQWTAHDHTHKYTYNEFYTKWRDFHMQWITLIISFLLDTKLDMLRISLYGWWLWRLFFTDHNCNGIFIQCRVVVFSSPNDNHSGCWRL